jgi:cytoskeleton-binding toxin CbtA-like protein
MQTQPILTGGFATPVTGGYLAALLSHLLDRHYGLTLNDTPFGTMA